PRLAHPLPTRRSSDLALRIARNDTTPLAGYDQDAYVPVCRAGNRTAEGLLKEYTAVRHSGICLFETFSNEMFNRHGYSNENPLTDRKSTRLNSSHVSI